MTSDDVIPVDEAVRSFDYLARRLKEAMRQRDLYRGWFERLLAAGALDAPALRAELTRVSAEYEHIVNARTRSNRRRGQENRDRILAMQLEGRSITATARDLDLSVSYVAHVRGKNKDAG